MKATTGFSKFWLFLILLLPLQLKAQVVVNSANELSNGNYLTVKEAFDAINAQDQTGFDILITLSASTTETATAVLNQGSWNHLTLIPSVTGLSISGSLATPLIDLNGADRVVIDGRVSPSDTIPDLIFENSNNSGTTEVSTLRLTSDAADNLIRYCVLKGSALHSSAGGILYFNNTANVIGNNTNTIDHNFFTNSGGNRPSNVILSAGAGNTASSGNIISNNRFYDFLCPVSTVSNGICLLKSSTGWTITGNKFFETVGQSYQLTTRGTFSCINIGCGTSHHISNNKIGGNNPDTEGNWVKPGGDVNFFGIVVYPVEAGTITLQGNLVRNISWTNSSGATFVGITVRSASNQNIGQVIVTGNTIGKSTGNGSIRYTGGSLCNFSAMNFLYAGDCRVEGNSIGSVTTSNLQTNRATNTYGLYFANCGICEILNNLVGSTNPATTNSIFASAPSAGTTMLANQWAYGIFAWYGNGNRSISGNTISGITNGAIGSNPYGLVGISTDRATITDNIITGLTSSDQGLQSTVSGIDLVGVTGNVISGNQISNLTNFHSSFSGGIQGIRVDNPSTTPCIISGNEIFNFSVTGSASTKALFKGIALAESNDRIQNNLIILGGNSQTTIYGIYEYGKDSGLNYTCNDFICHNTIVIDGLLPSGATNISAAFYAYSKAQNIPISLTNNLFINRRSTPGGSSLHFGIYLVSANMPLFDLDYNDYYVNGEGSALGFLAGNSLTGLPLFPGKDIHSLLTDPQFVSGTGFDPAGYIPSAFLPGLEGMGVLTDFGGNTRGSTPVIGAWEQSQAFDWALHGNVRYDNSQNTGLPNSTVELFQNQQLIAHAHTDSSGYFRFNVLPSGTYQVKTKSILSWGGVNAADALLTLKHFTGREILSGLKLKAADVNASGYVNSHNGLIILKRYSGLSSSFSVGDWIFEEPEIDLIYHQSQTLNLKGLCTGDVNGSFVP